jgi:hypothetical protein
LLTNVYACKKEDAIKPILNNTIHIPDSAASFECDSVSISACNPDSTKVNIRIVNGTSYDICSFVIDPGFIMAASYGNIESSKSTCYRSFPRALAGRDYIRFL